MNTPASPPDPAEKMSSRYEKPSLRGRPFVVGAIIFFVLMLTIFAVVWGLVWHWSHRPWPPQGPPSPVSAGSRWNNQATQLQVAPALDLAQVRLTEARRVHALRWNDASRAYATIPIEDAMRLLAEAAAKNQLTTVLPQPQPATLIQLQDQKSRETTPPQVPKP